MRVVDAFIFYNELEVLDIRLNVLNDVVDYFVLVESTVTHTGKHKRLYYQENKHLFDRFNHKIVHHVVDDTPNSFEEAREMFMKEKDETKRNVLMHTLTSTNTAFETQWMREFYQHENVRLGMAKIGLSDDDLCFNSDLDEIWNPDREYPVEDWNVVKLKQHVYMGFLNVKSSEEWYGTYYTKYKNIKNASSNHLDTVSKTTHDFLDNGGWHFTYQGGEDRIKTKLESYGHQEYNNDQVKSMVQRRLDAGMDVLGRPFSCVIDEESLPMYLKQNRNKYEHLFKSI
jgi:beta-1,4-mannosyl-glycoprotein beta-1,4-N-acetylglucosaminyltransferase